MLARPPDKPPLGPFTGRPARACSPSRYRPRKRSAVRHRRGRAPQVRRSVAHDARHQRLGRLIHRAYEPDAAAGPDLHDAGVAACVARLQLRAQRLPLLR